MEQQPQQQLSFPLTPENNVRLNSLCGSLDSHIKHIENSFNITINRRGNLFMLSGNQQRAHTAKKLIEHLYAITDHNTSLSDKTITLAINQHLHDQQIKDNHHTSINTGRKIIRAYTDNQASYIHNLHKFPINFAIGPAGTGKTYLAVACAVDAFNAGSVKKLVFVRPAVEAGEKLGFLPGDLAEKVNPYLRPLYDALYDLLGHATTSKLMQQNTIEIAPLAFMRGRTLSDAYIILDEAQNTTISQMQMFLTRLGFNAKMVIAGDTSQVDLTNSKSGLVHAKDILRSISGIAFNYFHKKDVVRHSLVKEIILAYDQANQHA